MMDSNLSPIDVKILSLPEHLTLFDYIQLIF